MSRIKISLPDHFIFSTEIPVRITDINYGGHVGNDTILTIIHEARVQYFISIGYTEMNVAGTSLIMSDAGIEFKNETFYGDKIKVYVVVDDFSRVSFNIFYKLVKKEEDKETIIAIAKTGMVGYNYDTNKVASIPAEAIEKMTKKI